MEPTCSCGCKGEVRFLDITRGFREFIRGHAARIPEKNNFVSKKAQQNSAKTRRKMIKNGKWKPFHLKDTGEHWGKGLTKEIDKRILKSAAWRNQPKVKEKYSKMMQENRLNGTIPTLYGPDHSQWKDGTSSLHAYCHGNSKIHQLWKTPKILAADYYCDRCRKKFKRNQLHVHHNKERMCDIIRKTAKQLGWEESINSNGLEKGLEMLKTKISNCVADYHAQNNVSGVVLCVECHKKEHSNLNFSNK